MPTTHFLTPEEVHELSTRLSATAKQLSAIGTELQSVAPSSDLPGIPMLSLPSLYRSLDYLEMLPARLRVGLLDLQSGIAAQRRKNADKAKKPKHRKSKSRR